jgi:acyl-CoA thioesterase FadM
VSESAASFRSTPAAGFEEWLPYRIVRPQRVRFEEAIPGETMRTAVFLAWAADVAWQHSALVGFDREWYSSRGLFWLVRAVRLDVVAPARANETVLVSTQVMGYRRIAARRHTEVRDPSGELLASIDIDWVMTNSRGVPTRVPQEMLGFVAEDATFELLRLELPDASGGASRSGICVRRRDLDPLDHVNNSVYLDYLEETLEDAGQRELLAAIPRRYEVEFLAAAGRADNLEGTAWPLETGWAFRLSRDDGTELFRARVSRL